MQGDVPLVVFELISERYAVRLESLERGSAVRATHTAARFAARHSRHLQSARPSDPSRRL